ncbi:MAG: stage II sporulation protein M [Planctomycetes bacterium]|nr:stage II sporulation protein M [Planctomycetota bacterium]
MKYGEFLEQSERARKEMAHLLTLVAKSRQLRGEDRQRVVRFPAVFRRLCQGLALAKHRDYSTRVVAELNRSALESHHRMYRQRSLVWRQISEFVMSGFPRAVRAEWKLVLLSSALMFGPVPILAFVIPRYPELAYSILGADQVALMEAMYAARENGVEVDRPVESDVFMFGFYVFNNVGVAFRTMAGGIAYGLGSVFFLLFNGLILGAVVGHLERLGAAHNLYQFVIAHGSFELTAIVISGVAGLMLGRGLLAPGRNSRARALRAAARQCVPLVCGAALMLVIAALFEAFWSPRPFPPEVKYAVGAALWAMVIGYLALAGRWSRGA